jgi:hypothetical protein
MSKINELLPLHNVQYEKIRTYRDVHYGKNTASGCTIRDK